MERLTAAGIPVLGLGTWQLTGRRCRDRVADALAIGYRHIDTAEAYENHEAVAEGIRGADVDREEIFLTTKLWTDHLEPDRVLERGEAMLGELGVDYLDLLLIHWPNPDIPLEGTLDAMMGLRDRGRIRDLGVSNFPASWLERAADHVPLICDQVEYHPRLGQDLLLRELRDRDMALVAYSPLAHGEALQEDLLDEIGKAHGRSRAQIALRWLVQQDGVAAIPKAGERSHLEENFAVFDFELTPDEMRRIHALAVETGDRTIDPDHAPTWERKGGNGSERGSGGEEATGRRREELPGDRTPR
jgi:2,5-diketo-D-gluconate reductase B